MRAMTAIDASKSENLLKFSLDMFTLSLTKGVSLQQGANLFYEKFLMESAASASLRRNARARRNSPLEPPFRRALASKRNFAERKLPRPNSQKSLWIRKSL